jgi:hydroxymethylbilane synthase
VGARAVAEGERLTVWGVVAKPDGSSLYRGEVSGSVTRPEELGRELAERLLSQGARQILDVE